MAAVAQLLERLQLRAAAKLVEPVLEALGQLELRCGVPRRLLGLGLGLG